MATIYIIQVKINISVPFPVDVHVKQEPITDDESRRRQRPHKSHESVAGNRRNQCEKEEKPNFHLSGALLKDTNTYKGVVIKYSEPIEAQKTKRRWRFYVFKGEQVRKRFLIL